ncbi:cell wall protein DAN4-like [Pecten maximus]|uniref:cell wall protein DAN4-like n=1 Tax=Pecten maximus TaxID=6579 RepID=UPI0014580DF9|nr:cell wall protein DAN4-like [Pecten maximus]
MKLTYLVLFAVFGTFVSGVDYCNTTQNEGDTCGNGGKCCKLTGLPKTSTSGSPMFSTAESTLPDTEAVTSDIPSTSAAVSTVSHIPTSSKNVTTTPVPSTSTVVQSTSAAAAAVSSSPTTRTSPTTTLSTTATPSSTTNATTTKSTTNATKPSINSTAARRKRGAASITDFPNSTSTSDPTLECRDSCDHNGSIIHGLSWFIGLLVILANAFLLP